MCACVPSCRSCFDRTYEYYLPAHVLMGGGAVVSGADSSMSISDSSGTPPSPLEAAVAAAAAPAGLPGDDGGADVAAAMGRLRAALGLYRGTHPFHNYTPRSKEYAQAPRTAEEQGGLRGGAAGWWVGGWGVQPAGPHLCALG